MLGDDSLETAKAMAEPDDANRHLAALGPGRANHHHLADLGGRWLRGFVRGDWLPRAGAPPWAFLRSSSTPGPGGRDRPLLESDDLSAHWPRLDTFEDDGYRRVITDVTTPDWVSPSFMRWFSAKLGLR